MKYSVIILLVLFCAEAGAQGFTRVWPRPVPFPENDNMRHFYLEELGVMELRGAMTTQDHEQLVKGRFNGIGWKFEFFQEDGSVADSIVIDLPEEYIESYTVTEHDHVDLGWRFESAVKSDSDKDSVPASLQFVGCGNCVSPEILSHWTLSVLTDNGDVSLEAKGKVHRPSRPSN